MVHEVILRCPFRVSVFISCGRCCSLSESLLLNQRHILQATSLKIRRTPSLRCCSCTDGRSDHGFPLLASKSRSLGCVQRKRQRGRPPPGSQTTKFSASAGGLSRGQHISPLSAAPASGRWPRRKQAGQLQEPLIPDGPSLPKEGQEPEERTAPVSTADTAWGKALGQKLRSGSCPSSP